MGDTTAGEGTVDTSWIPEGIWQLPLPILLIALLSLGIFVTRREHKNMIVLMEYFKGIVEKKDTTIQAQAEALNEYKTIAPLLRDVLGVIRSLAKEGRE
jgi:hypothetical protein